MRITLIYDNTAYREDLRADWGFSCLVEVEGVPTILFDTGAKSDVLLSNMKLLSVDPASIDEVFISHDHWDHTGGLADFLKANSDVRLYVPSSLKGEYDARETVVVGESIKLHEGVYSTGELDGIEQSLVVATDGGVVIVAGCSHPKMVRILDAASRIGKVRALIGGFHGFSEFDLIADLEHVCPTHCTQHTMEIRSLYPDKCIEGGAGKTIVF